jgi:hypothetical protein
MEAMEAMLENNLTATQYKKVCKFQRCIKKYEELLTTQENQDNIHKLTELLNYYTIEYIRYLNNLCDDLEYARWLSGLKHVRDIPTNKN